MPSHVYFDLDGTLTDSFEGISKCILYAVDKLGLPRPSDEYLEFCIGPPLYDTFPKMVGEELALKAIHLYRERFNEIGWLENKPYDGIHEALASIADAGYTLFVATSKPRIMAQRIIDHFEMRPYFERVFGSEFDGTHANKITLLRYAIEEIPGAFDRVMIGDRKYDLIGAIANNMQPIGVSYGYGSIEELTDAGAVSIVDNPARLKETIESVFSINR